MRSLAPSGPPLGEFARAAASRRGRPSRLRSAHHPRYEPHQRVGLPDLADVEYLIVGGHAVAFHGFPRFTGDFDFFIRMSEQNAQAGVSAADAV